MQNFDTIIIGAGHNGLICAAYLARSGQRVLVLEAADTLGGLAATREFYPGFKTSIAHSVSQFSTKIVRDLDLKAHGFKGSMSRKGDCWDNAVVESFFGSLKQERVQWRSYQTRYEAQQDILNYISMFY